MPGGDKTGPAGQGAMTGRGLGGCRGNREPGSAVGGRQGRRGGRGKGNGGGRGRGRQGQGGRGHRNRYHATGLTGWQRAAAAEQASQAAASPDDTAPAELDEVAMLKEQAAELAHNLQQVQQRLTSLEGRSAGSETTASSDD